MNSVLKFDNVPDFKMDIIKNDYIEYIMNVVNNANENYNNLYIYNPIESRFYLENIDFFINSSQEIVITPEELVITPEKVTNEDEDEEVTNEDEDEEVTNDEDEDKEVTNDDKDEEVTNDDEEHKEL